jgi:hypothetical protein
LRTSAACAGKRPDPGFHREKMNPFITAICLLSASAPGGSSFDEWRPMEQADTLEVFYKDRVVGTLLHSVQVIDTAKAICATTSLAIRRQEAGVSQMELLEQRWYNADGSLRNARQTMKSPSGVNTWTIGKTSQGWQQVVQAGGVSSSNIIDGVKENLRPTLDLYKKARSMLIKAGDTWTDTLVEMVSGRMVITTYRCKEVDKIKKVMTFDAIDDLAGQSQKWQLNASGKTLLQEIEGVFVARKAGAKGEKPSREDAVDISELANIMNVPVAGKAGQGEHIALVLSGGMVVDESVADMYRKKDGRWVLVYPEKGCACGPSAGADTALKQWTMPTATLQSDAPEISRLAKKIRGEEKDHCKIIAALTRHVFTSLEKRNSATFSSALETLKAGFGDCGEHAVLLAALLRSTRIPARVVFGLCYYEPKKAYVGHAWVMAWAGSWIFVDPAFGIFPACQDRVPLMIDDNGRGMVFLARFVGRIGIEYVPGN